MIALDQIRLARLRKVLDRLLDDEQEIVATRRRCYDLHDLAGDEVRTMLGHPYDAIAEARQDIEQIFTLTAEGGPQEQADWSRELGALAAEHERWAEKRQAAYDRDRASDRGPRPIGEVLAGLGLVAVDLPGGAEKPANNTEEDTGT